MFKKQNTRLEAFNQIKFEIRGSKTHLIVGIDIAKEKHNAFFGTANGKTLLKRLVFFNDSQGFEKLLSQTEAIKVKNGLEKVVFGVEPTASYHKPLGEYLIKRGHALVLVSSNAVKKNRELLDGRWDKHDTKDAANVADLISQGKCLYYDYPAAPIREIQSLLSLKRKLKKMEHSIRMRIQNHLLSQYFPEMDKYFSKGKDESLSVIKHCISPAKIAGIEYDEFCRIVGVSTQSIFQQERMTGISQSAEHSIGCQVGEAVEFEAGLLVDRLRQIRQDRKNTDKKIETACKKCPEYGYLLSIPGIGPAISAMTLGALGDPYRFTNSSQVLKLAGLDLSASRSGNKSDGVTPSISKKGKSELRYGLYQAAKIASSKNIDFMNYLTEKLRGREKEKGIKTKMLVKLAAKMLVMAWTLMKHKVVYDATYIKKSTQKIAG